MLLIWGGGGRGGRGGEGEVNQEKEERKEGREDCLRVFVANSTVLSELLVAGGIANAELGLDNDIWN